MPCPQHLLRVARGLLDFQVMAIIGQQRHHPRYGSDGGRGILNDDRGDFLDTHGFDQRGGDRLEGRGLVRRPFSGLPCFLFGLVQTRVHDRHGRPLRNELEDEHVLLGEFV